MRMRLEGRDVTVLLRLAAVIVLVLRLPHAVDVWGVWTTQSHKRALMNAGLVPREPALTLLRELVWSGWPLAAAVVLYFGARPLARLVLRGLPGPGCCPECGYDLKGSAGGPCPECGARSTPGV